MQLWANNFNILYIFIAFIYLFYLLFHLNVLL